MAEHDEPLEWLKARGAQGDVIDGLRAMLGRAPETDRGWRRLWEGCPRGDWLLGIATRLGVSHRTLVTAAAACARTAATPSEAAAEPLLARAFALVDLTERAAAGEASEEEVRAATRALDAASARAPSPAVDAAIRAALAVGMGLEDREVLAGAPACAAEAVMMATLDCGMPLVMGYAHAKCADAVRAAVPWSMVAPLVGVKAP